MVLKVVLLLTGMVTAYVAIAGLVRGSVYCKGGPFPRATRPVAFWTSIAVYLLWTALTGYFSVFGQG